MSGLCIKHQSMGAVIGVVEINLVQAQTHSDQRLIFDKKGNNTTDHMGSKNYKSPCAFSTDICILESQAGLDFTDNLFNRSFL